MRRQQAQAAGNHQRVERCLIKLWQRPARIEFRPAFRQHPVSLRIIDQGRETLAPRETEILDYVAQGYSNKEIADKLELTIGTVCWYLHEVYRKLHVQSRVQAVNKVRQSNLAKRLPGMGKR